MSDNRTIGILLKKPENTFSNGCIQQVLFLYKLFNNANYKVDFLSVEQDYTEFELTGTPVIVTTPQTDFSKYHCVILGSLILTNEGPNIPYIKNLVSYNIPIINLICGNVFILHQEEFVFNTHHIITNYIQDYVTEYWVMEMYDYALDYVKMLSGKPAKIVPYTWDIDIIENYIKKNNVFTNPTQSLRDHSKVNLLVFEPNMSIHKNALIPILICEEYYKQHPDRVNKIYCFCSDKVKDTLNPKFLQHLSIMKDSKLEFYGRIVMPYIVDVIEKNNPYLNVVVSYNLLNRLNFLHLEMFYLGIPIIHNCSPFKDNQYYFEDFKLMDAVERIESARTSFVKDDYKRICFKYIIDEFSPSNLKRIQSYKAILDNIGEHTLPKTTQEIQAYDVSVDVPNKRFLQGDGYVVVVNDDDDLHLSISKLQNIALSTSSLVHAEMFYHNSVNVKSIKTILQNNITNLKMNMIEIQDKKNMDQAMQISSFKNKYSLY